MAGYRAKMQTELVSKPVGISRGSAMARERKCFQKSGNRDGGKSGRD